MAAAAAAAAPSACSRCIFRVGGVMVTGGGSRGRKGGGLGSFLLVTARGGGWCEGVLEPYGGPALVFACVILTVLVPLCVGACAHGAQFLLHTCS